MAQRKQRVVLALQFAREQVGALALGEALDDQDDMRAAAPGLLKDRPGVDVEDTPAGPAAKILDGSMVAVVDVNALHLATARAHRAPARPTLLQQPAVTALIVEQVVEREGKKHGRGGSSERNWQQPALTERPIPQQHQQEHASPNGRDEPSRKMSQSGNTLWGKDGA